MKSFTNTGLTKTLMSLLAADNKRLEAADSVLIIGGGPVGVELAGEIVVDFPTKKVSQVRVSESVIRVEINTEVSAHLFKEINNW